MLQFINMQTYQWLNQTLFFPLVFIKNRSVNTDTDWYYKMYVIHFSALSPLLGILRSTVREVRTVRPQTEL